jgi:ATP-dependent Clp protease protease subunit
MNEMQDSALLQHRILFLCEPVSPESAGRLVTGLFLLDAVDRERPIDLYVNSPGGSVTDGMAVIDAMRGIAAPVRTVCVGLAASMAAWILAAGEKGSRRASPNAEVMLHQANGGVAGPTADVQIHARRMLRWQERLISLMSEWTGQDVERVRQDLERDHFLTAEEAVAYGIVDEILKGPGGVR